MALFFDSVYGINISMNKKGFTLPTVFVVGTVLLIVLMFTLQTAVTTRNVLKHQHAQTLAKQAAESGLAKAKYCLYRNDRVVTWGESHPNENKNRALRPNTDCKGVPIKGKSKYVVDNGKYRTSFEVNPNDLGGDNSISATTTGRVEYYKKKSNNKIDILRTYKDNVSIYMKTKTTFNDVVFGNIYANKGSNTPGSPRVTRQSYYITKSRLGVVSFAGSNKSYQLTGSYKPSLVGLKTHYETPTQLKFGKYVDSTHMQKSVKISKIFTNYEGEGWNVFYLTDKGEVFGTGNDYNGQLATGCHFANSKYPVKCTDDNSLSGNRKSIISDWESFKTATENFFNGWFGFLTTPIDYIPTNWPFYAKMNQETFKDGEKVEHIIPTGLNTYFYTSKRRIFSAGKNQNSLGHEHYDPDMRSIIFNTPKAVRPLRMSSQAYPIELPSESQTPGNKKENRLATTDLAYGRYYMSNPTILLKMKGGAVLGWGNNHYGQMGVNKKIGLINVTKQVVDKPTYLKTGDGEYFGSTDDLKVVDVATDGGTSWIVTKDGSVWSAGNNRLQKSDPTTINTVIGGSNASVSLVTIGSGQLGRQLEYKCGEEKGLYEHLAGCYKKFGDYDYVEKTCPIGKVAAKAVSLTNPYPSDQEYKCWNYHGNVSGIYKGGRLKIKKLQCNPGENKAIKVAELYYCAFDGTEQIEQGHCDNAFHSAADLSDKQDYEETPGSAGCWEFVKGLKLPQEGEEAHPGNEFHKIIFKDSNNNKINVKVKKVVSSHQVAMFLTEDGKVYGVGNNDQGQLGINAVGSADDNSGAVRPTLFKGLENEFAIDLYVTSPSLRFLDTENANAIVNSFVVTRTGKVFGAGSNRYGQLGIGSQINGNPTNNNNGCNGLSEDALKKSYKMPVQMKIFGETEKSPKARSVMSGFGTTIVITEGNRVYTVGNNKDGQIGYGNLVGGFINPQKTCYPKDYDNTNLAEPLFY